MAENNKHLFPQTSGGQKSENKVLAGLVPLGTSICLGWSPKKQKKEEEKF